MEEESGSGYVAAGGGTPLVMIPGGEGAKEFWRFQVDGLASGYRVFACDLANRRPRLSSTVSDYAADVIRIMDESEIEKAVVVGESFGGMVAQELATAHGRRLLALVLCNTMAHPMRFGFGFNVFTLATFMHQFAFMPFLSDEQRKSILMWVGKHRGFVMDPSPGNLEFCDYIIEYGTACGAGCYLDRAIAGSKIDFTGKLADISVPTLVLRGTEDRLVRPEATLELVGRIPGARLALIDGGGHCCQYTLPGETNRVIREWLNSIGL